MTFGKMLRQSRRARGLTLADVAGQAGISVPYLSELERGTRGAPPDETVRRIAAAVGSDYEVLIVASSRLLVDELREQAAHSPAIARLLRAIANGEVTDSMAASWLDNLRRAT